MSSATLRVTSGPRQGQNLPLAESGQNIGREDTCDIALGDYDGVSRRHARLWCENGEWIIQDLGSTNGVRVNGQGTRQAVLQLPCRLQLGDFVAELVSSPATANSSLELSTSHQASSRRARSRWIVTGALGVVVVAFGAWAMTGRETDTPTARETKIPTALKPNAPSALPGESGTPSGALPAGPPAAPQSFEPQNNRPSAQALQTAKSATVMVVTREGNNLGFGSAFLARDAQHIITNRHVVVNSGGRAQDCLLVFNSGTPRETKLEVRADQITLAPASGSEEDFTSDLAVIRLDQPVPATLAAPLAIGRSEELNETDTIHVLGFPLGVGTLTLDDQLPSVSVKAVTVERVQRRAGATPDAGEVATVLQIGGTVTKGNSGGPVINNRGEVVGVISRGADGTGMAYAIPTTFVQALLP